MIHGQGGKLQEQTYMQEWLSAPLISVSKIIKNSANRDILVRFQNRISLL